MDFVRNVASLIAYRRYYDSIKDGVEGQTRHWWFSFLLITLIVFPALTGVGNVLLRSRDDNPAQRLGKAVIAGVGEVREIKKMLLENSTLVLFTEARDLASQLQEIATGNDIEPVLALLRECRSVMKKMESETPTFVGNATIEFYSKIIDHVEGIIADGNITEAELKGIKYIAMRYISQEDDMDLSPLFKATTLNYWGGVAQGLGEVIDKNEQMKKNIEKLENSFITVVKSVGYDVPLRSAFKFCKDEFGVPEYIAGFLFVLFLGPQTVIFVALCMQVYGHWLHVTHSLVSRGGRLVVEPTIVTWYEFVISLWFGEGWFHVPLMTLWFVSVLAMNTTYPLYGWMCSFSQRKLEENARNRSSWAYVIYHSTHQVLSNIEPLKWLFYGFVLTNTLSGSVIVSYLAFLNYKRGVREVLGYHIERIAEMIKIKFFYLVVSYKGLLVVLLVIVSLALLIRTMKKLDGLRSGAIRRLVNGYRLPFFFFSVIKMINDWKGSVSLLVTGCVPVANYIETIYPTIGNLVPDQGWVDMIMQMVTPFSGVEAFVPDLTKQTIIEYGMALLQ